jgi:hypothetical protein
VRGIFDSADWVAKLLWSQELGMEGTSDRSCGWLRGLAGIIILSRTSDGTDATCIKSQIDKDAQSM